MMLVASACQGENTAPPGTTEVAEIASSTTVLSQESDDVDAATTTVISSEEATASPASAAELGLEVPSGKELLEWLAVGWIGVEERVFAEAAGCMEALGYRDVVVYVEPRPVVQLWFGITYYLAKEHPGEASGWDLSPDATIEQVVAFLGDGAPDDGGPSDAENDWGTGCLAEGLAAVLGGSMQPFVALEALVDEVESAVDGSDRVVAAREEWAECAITKTTEGVAATKLPAGWFPQSPSTDDDLATAVYARVDALFDADLTNEEFVEEVDRVQSFEEVLFEVDRLCRAPADLDRIEQGIRGFEMQAAFERSAGTFVAAGWDS